MRWGFGLVGLVVGVCLLLALSIEALAYSPSVTPPACTNCVIGTIPTGSGSGSFGPDIAYDNASGDLFVSSSDVGSWGVTVINGSTDAVVKTIPDSGRPIALAYDDRNGDLYVANWGVENNVTVIDSETDIIVDSISLPPQQLGGVPIQAVYDPVNGFVDVIQTYPAELVMINGSTNQIAEVQHLYVVSDTLAVNPVNGNLYGATGVSYSNFTFIIINGANGSVMSSATLNGYPAAIDYVSENGQIYVGAFGPGFGPYAYNGSLVEINSNGATIRGEWRIGQLPYAIAYDGSNENLYVTNYYSANVSVLNTSTGRISGSIPVAEYPGPIAYDGKNGCLYTVGVEGLVSILAPPRSSCPPTPVPGLNALLLLSAGGFVGLVMAVVAYGYGRTTAQAPPAQRNGTGEPRSMKYGRPDSEPSRPQ